MKKSPPLLLCFLAAAFAPLVIPFTGGWLFFVLHQRFYPSVWGLPPLQSLIGVSINCTMIGYFFTWFYALPLVLILRRLNQYRLSVLLFAGAMPSFSLPFWQADWKIAVLPVSIAGISTAYAFWRLTKFGMDQLNRAAHHSAD
ncbi:MAG TPA: hypothetical protein VNW52_04275 [Burkholderiaceae bacterium]|jgi:hypothetical protein|nr:hypothetical protein [Burkholderiaceae bacterium]